MAETEFLTGDSLDILDQLQGRKMDLVYLDPPFFTQKTHELTTRDGKQRFSFTDLWHSHEHYATFLRDRIVKCRELLDSTGSLFFHCDPSGSHIARLVLDHVFGPSMFQAEIIWSYRRWSNSKKGLLPAHQTILFYAKTPEFKFRPKTTEYSESTNLDQIMQRRTRDHRNKAVYARDENGDILHNGAKNGVPLSDVWDIPYLNPKARERCGYPTQKPILLLDQVISLVTDEGDWVLDPFCGSGTTLVSARLLDRNSIGIDISSEAIALSRHRVQEMVRSESRLVQLGRSEYRRKDIDLLDVLGGVKHHPVMRNSGIDAILEEEVAGKPVLVRIQRAGESIGQASTSLLRAASHKGPAHLVVIVTDDTERDLDLGLEGLHSITLIPALSYQVRAALTTASGSRSEMPPSGSVERCEIASLFE